MRDDTVTGNAADEAGSTRDGRRRFVDDAKDSAKDGAEGAARPENANNNVEVRSGNGGGVGEQPVHRPQHAGDAIKGEEFIARLSTKMLLSA